MAKTSWLKDCNICRVGLADAIDALKAKGSSENAACKELAKETESLGWSAESLKGMYRWATGKVKKKACDSHTKKDKKKAPKKKTVFTKPADEYVIDPDDYAPLFEHIEEEYASSGVPAPTVLRLPKPVKGMLKEIIKIGYRELAKIYHPDKPTGSTKNMAALNNAKAFISYFCK